MASGSFTDSLRQPVPFGSQLVLAMAAAALAPMIVLIAVGYAFFYDDPNPQMSFQYWSFLVVVWVLGIAFLIARLVAGGLMRQLEGVASAAVGESTGAPRRVSSTVASNDFADLEEKFNQIHAVVAEGRAASLGKIHDLEEEVAGLKEAAELQAQFLSAISHEIRTPLSAIISSARIIQRYREKKPEVVGRFGDIIIAEGNRLVGTISDMVDLVKIESGRLEWRDDEVRGEKIASEVGARAAVLADRHGLSFSADVASGLPSAWGDPQRVGQVLDALLTNAIRFTPRGGSVRLTVRESEDGGLSFAVADTGIGVEAAELATIFDKSNALSARRRDQDGKKAGTGLGLVLSREIVHRHGGTLSAESQAGSGSTFRFTMPPLDGQHVPVHAGAAGGERLRVLLLIRNSVFADCAVRALRLEEIEARVCTSLQEFFAALPEWTPDVVVVSPSFAWQLNDDTEQRIRKAGVPHILVFSENEGFVEMSPPTHSEPLLAGLGRVAAHGSTVLLVEDDDEYGAVVEFELEQAGYTVIKAYNGLDAVEMVVEQRPAAIVLDLVLPQLDGFGVIERLKERDAATPTVVLTSLDDETLDERLTSLGAAAVFRKYELIQARGSGSGARVKQILSPVLAANPGENVDSGVLLGTSA